MKTNYLNNLLKVDENEIKKRISSIDKNNPTKEELQLALSLIDLTTLEGSDTDEKINQLTNKAINSGVAAVCVFPVFVKQAKTKLSNTSIKVASVAGAFPSGQLPLELRLEEAKYAINEGANEIDMVMSRGKLLEKNYQFIFDEVNEFKKACGEKKLKVILETGELDSFQNIQLAADIAIKAGADFIKTSTGKISVNATLESVAVMLLEIKKHFETTGKKVGIKPSGGISDGNTAVQYIRLVKMILGDEWLTPNLFRFGASRLVDNLNNMLNSNNNNLEIGDGY